MPYYPMKNLETGKTEDIVMTVQEMLDSCIETHEENGRTNIYEIDGIKYEQDYEAKFGGSTMFQSTVWPLISNGAAIDPSQVQDAKKKLKAAGCPTDFTAAGQPIFTSPGHKRKHLRLRGMHDKQSYT